MRTADNKLSATGKVFVVACAIFAVAVSCLVALLVVVVGVKDISEQNRDQSEQNQRHIDCIVALAQPVIPRLCEPVKAQLIADGIIPPGFDRSTTTVAIPTRASAPD